MLANSEFTIVTVGLGCIPFCGAVTFQSTSADKASQGTGLVFQLDKVSKKIEYNWDEGKLLLSHFCSLCSAWR